jgi:hypothetical protein
MERESRTDGIAIYWNFSAEDMLFKLNSLAKTNNCPVSVYGPDSMMDQLGEVMENGRTLDGVHSGSQDLLSSTN